MEVSPEFLLNKVKAYDHSRDLKYLEPAIEFACYAHKSQKRASGEPYFIHPLNVANILADINMDSGTIIGGLLHDVVEDTKFTLKDIATRFTPEIADLVDGVTKLTKIEGKNESILQAENFRKLIIAVSHDIRVLIIKLADRLHNMRTLSYVKSKDKRHKVALETMEIYAQLAERIGMQVIKNELQDLAFSELYPEVKNSILTRLALLRTDGEELVQDIVRILKNIIKEGQIDADVYGREKTPYSIWMKMKTKNISFEQLSDVMAFRIIVNDLADCYKVLGVIHSKYHMVPGYFKDFISTPKKNGYQSLHTVVMGPENQRIEIQIRSKSMNRTAEVGIAAHWSYKQHYEETDRAQYTWINELLQILESVKDPRELLESTKLEMYDDQVFCFTPKGRVVALPRGACAIDFAYAVHSDVGNHCVGVKINRRLAPLKTKLENGDQVEIIISKTHSPLPSWEKFVITGRALSEIRKAIRHERYHEYVNLGRMIVTQTIESSGIPFTEEYVKEIMLFFNKESINDFYCSVGEGHIPQAKILKYIKPAKKFRLRDSLYIFKFNSKKKIENKHKLPIKGLTPGMAVHFASCCSPIPGDQIVGIQHPGKGLTVHVSGCDTLQNYSSNPETWVDLAWDKESNQNVYNGTINAVVSNEPGSLANIAMEIAKHNSNITNFQVKSRSTDFFDILIDVEIKGVNQLEGIVAALREKSCVQSVHRYKRD